MFHGINFNENSFLYTSKETFLRLRWIISLDSDLSNETKHVELSSDYILTLMASIQELKLRDESRFRIFSIHEKQSIENY